jgi:heme exporter protein D
MRVFWMVLATGGGLFALATLASLLGRLATLGSGAPVVVSTILALAAFVALVVIAVRATRDFLRDDEEEIGREEDEGA